MIDAGNKEPSDFTTSCGGAHSFPHGAKERTGGGRWGVGGRGGG